MCDGKCQGTCGNGGGCPKADTAAPETKKTPVWALSWPEDDGAPKPDVCFIPWYGDLGIELRYTYGNDTVFVLENTYRIHEVRARAVEVLGADAPFVHELDVLTVERFVHTYTDMAHLAHAQMVRQLEPDETALLSVDTATLPAAVAHLVSMAQRRILNPAVDMPPMALISDLVRGMLRDVADADRPITGCLLRALTSNPAVRGG